jgi:predicted PurR-regulated permease PerM
MRKIWPRELRYTIGISMAILLMLFLWYIRELFRPLIIGGLIAYLLMPVVNLLKKRLRWPHKLAANLVFFLMLGVILASPALVVPWLVANLQDLSQALVDLFTSLQAALSHPVKIGVFTIPLQQISPTLGENIVGGLNALPENALHWLENISRNLAWFLVAIITAYYTLLDWEKMREWMIHQAPEPYRKEVRRLYLEIKRIWNNYLRGTLALMAIVWAFFTIVYLSIGLPGAVGLGLLIGFLSIIPDIGPLIGALIAVFIALVEGSLYLGLSNFWFAMLVLGIYTLFINVKNIWIRPYVMGRSVHLHEGLVFIIIMAAIVFQGVLGALIVVPVFASALVIGRYLKRRILGQDPFGSPLIDLKAYPKPEPVDLRREIEQLEDSPILKRKKRPSRRKEKPGHDAN